MFMLILCDWLAGDKWDGPLWLYIIVTFLFALDIMRACAKAGL